VVDDDPGDCLTLKFGEKIRGIGAKIEGEREKVGRIQAEMEKDMEQKEHILIVDDDESTRKSLALIFGKKGYVTDTAATGQEALAKARQQFFNLALLDIRLPDMEGVELLTLLKEMHPDIMLLIVTGYASLKTAVEVLNNGASGYLTKPLNVDEMLAKVRDALEKQRLAIENRRLYQAAQQELAERNRAETMLEKRAAQLALLNEIGGQIAAVLKLGSVLERAAHLVHERFGYHHVALFTIDREQDELVMKARAGAFAHVFPPEHRIKLGEGMNGWVAQHGQKLLANDVRTEPHYVNFFPAMIPTQSELSVPIRIGKEIVGVLDTQSPQLNTFDENDVMVIETLANQIAVAIENARLYEAVQRELNERKRAEGEICRRNRELTLLNQIIAASATGLEPATILETACRELALTFEVPQTAATLLNEEETIAIVVAEYRREDRPTVLNENILVKDNPVMQYLLTHKTPLAVSDVQNDPRLASIHDSLGQRGIASILVLPLMIEQEVVGSLSLEMIEPHTFPTEEVNLAWSVADQVAGALARARLVQAYQRLFTAIEQTAESVVITDTKGSILYVNPAFERVSGYSQAEVIGQNPRMLKSGKQDAAFYEELWATITAGKVWQGRLINKKKDSRLYTEDATISPVRNKNGIIINYVAVKRDITRELELEAQYHQAQKMETVGQLTGGIAHDFNNLLTAVIGFAELTQIRSSLDEHTQKMVDKILYTGRSATDLVGQLMAFSRKQVIEPKVLNLNQVVADIDKMLRRIIGENTQMETMLEPNLWPVKVDPTQIEQVIVNLAVNARDAMPEGGRLAIETANVVLDNEYVADHLDTQPGNYVLLAVSDTGSGMSKEVQERLFEPFFTTKEKGKGSGLGLATVFGIVKQSGGHIWVYSEEGMGTTFKIYLPKSKEVTTDSVYQDDQINVLPSGTETVLLVEDDPAVREVAAYTLRQQGYTVLEATNGQEALHLVSECNEEIHLLLTDVVMPEMNGKVLADQIQSVRPNIKALFTSGYTDDAIVQHGVLKPDIAFISKPFLPSALARKVRETLDTPQSE
jgi:PAS domain S-box-containing protein